MIAFNVFNDKMSKPNLDDYEIQFNNKYDGLVTALTQYALGGLSLKVMMEHNEPLMETSLNKLKDDGFIFTSKSTIELHKPYKIKSMVEIKSIIVGLLRAQVKNFLLNKELYDTNHRVLDSATLTKWSTMQSVNEFATSYLGAINPEYVIETELDAQKILNNKMLRHPSWCDMIPMLRSYYNVNYRNETEIDEGKGTYFLKLRMLKKDTDQRPCSRDIVNNRVYILARSMNDINAS